MEGKETAGRRETAGGRETPAETETARRPRPNEMVTSGADSLVVCRLEREGGTVAHNGDRERWAARHHATHGPPRCRASAPRPGRSARVKGTARKGSSARAREERREPARVPLVPNATPPPSTRGCNRKKPTIEPTPHARPPFPKPRPPPPARAPAARRRLRGRGTRTCLRPLRGDPALADGGGRDGGDGGRPEDDARGATGRAVPPGDGRERVTGGNG